jgi:hypothetical protein
VAVARLKQAALRASVALKEVPSSVAASASDSVPPALITRIATATRDSASAHVAERTARRATDADRAIDEMIPTAEQVDRSCLKGEVVFVSGFVHFQPFRNYYP